MMCWIRRVALVVVVLIACAIASLASLRLAAYLRENESAAAAAPADGRFVESGHGRMFVMDPGPKDGVPVILFHGTAAWSKLWWRTTAALKNEGYRPIVPDLPPFGYSERQGGYSRLEQAARIDGMMTTLGTGRAIVVGHSFGAGAALEYVVRHPDRVIGLVLVDAALGLTQTPADASAILNYGPVRQLLVSATATNPLATRFLLSKLIYRQEAATDATLDILKAPMRVEGTTSHIADWLLYFAGSDRSALSASRDEVARVELPVSIIWGDRDDVTPLAQANDLRSLIPSASLHVMRNVGHIPQIEDPDAFNAALLAAIREVISANTVTSSGNLRREH
ncbi:alpha/beta fold hydrolase [Bradyrhizobium liaoningense]|uniref:alpha/beta fold hydrolase n=1 Tax=Bradyrhizobium liaoningense TaxID=43992 RepID=UPI001BAB761F|nr:alpha/beta hydrolase [Bradyrhizobium liaoningense]MBR0985761.1 alpha/beta hydrolase [Bradyrhizobium liaoningense]